MTSLPTPQPSTTSRIIKLKLTTELKTEIEMRRRMTKAKMKKLTNMVLKEQKQMQKLTGIKHWKSYSGKYYCNCLVSTYAVGA